MTIKSITVFVECDECAWPFSVEMEASDEPPEGWSVWEMAEDAIRGSLEYKDGGTNDGSIFSSSVQGGKQLCRRCTRIADEKGQEPT